MGVSSLVSIAEVGSSLQHPDLVLVDCRFSLEDSQVGRSEYQKAHIPGAVYAHLDEDLSGEIVEGERPCRAREVEKLACLTRTDENVAKFDYLIDFRWIVEEPHIRGYDD